MDTTSQKSLTDAIINGLKKAVVELEEFRVQAALGKAEARDAFEDAKKKLHHFIHEAQQVLAGSQSHITLQLKVAIEELQVQLALGKAETRDAFEEQRKKLLHALHELENFLEHNEIADGNYEQVQREITKFRIKLEILKLRYDLEKMDVKDEFEARKREFSIRLEKIKQHFHDKEAKAGKAWDHFRQDIAEAYGDLKKAFVG